MKYLLLLIFLCGNVYADDPHHEHQDPGDSYTVVKKYFRGQAAIGAMMQIHPSENISGLQLGVGIAQAGNRTGKAVGAAFNFKGLGMFNGSIAKEGRDTILGAGFNFSLKP